MTRQTKEDRIRALRADADFKALVKCLSEQTPEQVEAFVEYAERSDHPQEGDADNGREE